MSQTKLREQAGLCLTGKTREKKDRKYRREDKRLLIIHAVCAPETPPHSVFSHSHVCSSFSPLPRPARGHRRPADQVQHVRQRHRQVGVHTPPRGGPEGADPALRSAAGPRSRSHHEEPGGSDAAGPGHGVKGFLLSDGNIMVGVSRREGLAAVRRWNCRFLNQNFGFLTRFQTAEVTNADHLAVEPESS